MNQISSVDRVKHFDMNITGRDFAVGDIVLNHTLSAHQCVLTSE